jgi:hypothetical protein
MAEVVYFDAIHPCMLAAPIPWNLLSCTPQIEA